jgi:hypothetical protein
MEGPYGHTYEENDAFHVVNPLEEEEEAGHYHIHDRWEEVVDDMSTLACEEEEVDHDVRGQGSKVDLLDYNVAIVDALAPVVQKEDSKNFHPCWYSQKEDNRDLYEMSGRWGNDKDMNHHD